MIAVTLLAVALSVAPAQRVFDDARIASEEDGGTLWGKALYGPMILVDRETKSFVKNDGTAGTLPKETIVANTATPIDGVLTTMIAWQSIRGTAVQRRRLAMHECWHRI
jgi:hypothetical protein